MLLKEYRLIKFGRFSLVYGTPAPSGHRPAPRSAAPARSACTYADTTNNTNTNN